MKKLLKIALGIGLIIGSLFLIDKVSAAVCLVQNGCTGTGQIPTTGQTLIGNASGTYTPGTITGGSSTIIYGVSPIVVSALVNGNQTTSFDTTVPLTISGQYTFSGGIKNASGTAFVPPATYSVCATGADYTTLQPAMDAASSSGGGTVNVCNGTYVITATTTFGGNNIHVLGQGNATIIQFNGSSTPYAFANNKDGVSAVIHYNDELGNMEIVSTAVGQGTCLLLDKFNEVYSHDITCINANGGAYANGNQTFQNNLQRWTVDPVGTNNFGFSLNGAANDNALTNDVVNPDASGTTTGVVINGTKGTWINTLWVETPINVTSTTGIGVDIQTGSDNTSIINSWLEKNNIDIQIAAGDKATSIIGDQIEPPATALINDLGGVGTFVQSDVNNGDLLAYGGDNVKLELGTTTAQPASGFNLYMVGSSTKEGIDIKGAGNSEVQSSIQLESSATLRGSGIFTYDSGSNAKWYFGTCYNSNGIFCINHQTNANQTSTSAANPVGSNVSNFLTISNSGQFEVVSNPNNSTTIPLLLLSPNALLAGNPSGTYIGINATSTYNGDFLNFQENSTTKFKVASSGLITTTLTNNSFVATDGSGNLVATTTPGGLASTTPFTIGNLVVVSSSGALSTISSSTYYLATNPSNYISTSTGLTTANFASSNVSQWTNDSGYLTSSTAGALYYPLNSNPAGYVTSTPAALTSINHATSSAQTIIGSGNVGVSTVSGLSNSTTTIGLGGGTAGLFTFWSSNSTLGATSSLVTSFNGASGATTYGVTCVSGCTTTTSTTSTAITVPASGTGNLFVTPTSSVVSGNFPYYVSNGSSTVSGTSSISQSGTSTFINASTTYLGSSTSTATSSLIWKSNGNGAGYWDATGTIPTLSSCGTLPTSTGNMDRMRIIAGSGVVTSCTVTFPIAFVKIPSCIVDSEASLSGLAFTPSTSTLVISATSLTSDAIDASCEGQSE